MAANTISGNFTVAAVSAPGVAVSDGELTYTIAGTFVATVVLEKSNTPSQLSWLPVIPVAKGATTGTIAVRTGEVFRMRCLSYTSGQATFSFTPPSVVLRTTNMAQVTNGSAKLLPNLSYTGAVSPHNFAGSSSSGPFTLAEMWNTDAPFDYVYLVYWNCTTTAFLVTRASVAPSASVNDNFTPLAVDGSGVTPTAVTFNNAGALVSPAESATGSTTSFTVPANTANDIFNPVFYYSDPIPVSALARTDSGLGFLLMSRSYLAAGTSASSINYGGIGAGQTPVSAAIVAAGSGFPNGQVVLTATLASGTPTKFSVLATAAGGSIVSIDRITSAPMYAVAVPGNPVAMTDAAGVGSGVTLNLTWSGALDLSTYLGRNFWSGYSSGDCVTTPASFAVAGLGVHLAVGMIPVARVKGASVLVIGSSWQQGNNTPGNMSSYVTIAANAVSSPTLPINVWNAAKSGAASDILVRNAVALIAKLNPQIVFIEGYDGNDALTPAGVLQGWQRAISIADLATRYGAVPVLTGPIPSNAATTTAQEGYRQQTNAWLDAYVADGGYAIYPDRTLGNGANPQRYKPEFDTDGIHPSLYAHQVMALGPMSFGDNAARIIQKILNLPLTF